MYWKNEKKKDIGEEESKSNGCYHTYGAGLPPASRDISRVRDSNTSRDKTHSSAHCHPLLSNLITAL